MRLRHDLGFPFHHPTFFARFSTLHAKNFNRLISLSSMAPEHARTVFLRLAYGVGWGGAEYRPNIIIFLPSLLFFVLFFFFYAGIHTLMESCDGGCFSPEDPPCGLTTSLRSKRRLISSVDMSLPPPTPPPGAPPPRETVKEDNSFTSFH